jgi:NAD(P) transhydrogenase subunit alpha
MTIKLAVPKEISPGEKRVAMDPAVAARLAKAGVQVLVQKGAGTAAQIPDQDYTQAQIVANAADLYAQADVVFKVAPPPPMRSTPCTRGRWSSAS